MLSLWIAIGNTLEAVCGVMLLRRLGAATGPFNSASSVFKFLVAALLMCLVSSTVGATGLAVFGIAPWVMYSQIWFTWWLGDLAGVLILTPAILSLFKRPGRAERSHPLWERALLFAGLFAVGLMTFELWFPSGILRSQVYLLIPFLLWSVFRFGQRQVTLAILLISGIAIWATVSGSGPFFIPDSLNVSLLLLQSFVCMVALTMLSLVAVLTERRQASEQLAAINETLEQRVADRTFELARANTELQREIAERKNAEEQLRQSQRLEAVGQLSAGIAHNFNNLLQGIMASLDVALGAPQEQVKRHLLDAQETSMRGAEIVRELLLFTRTADPAKSSPIDIGQMLSETVAICQQTFDRRIDITLQSPESLPATLGDSGQLQQVFLNICLNARDAVKATAAPFIRLEASQRNGTGAEADRNVRIQVSDNGAGMEEAVKARIFEPFFTTKEVGAGTGLGLATAFGIVKHHGGWIECESTKGVGTTFTVSLPSADGNIQFERMEDSVQPASSGGTETILVIDDEEIIRTSLSTYLSGLGYRVLQAEDGEKGLDVYRQHQEEVDLVVLDLSMPKISGEEVLRSLRDLDVELKVMIFTGYNSDAHTVDESLHVITKPAKASVVARQIREVLDAR